MKTQLPSAIILCALLLVLSLHAFAAGNQTTHVSSSGTSHGASNASALLANALGTRYTGYTITIQPTAAGEAAPTAALLSDASSRTCSAGRWPWRARPISLPRRSCGRCIPVWP